MTTAALLLISCWIVSDSLWPHRLQHTRFSCPSLSPGICSSSCPLSWWCYLTITASASLFFCLQSFPASESFPMSQLFASDGQSVEASASASVLSMNIQNRFPLRLIGLISLRQGNLKSLLQHHSLKASVFWCSAFFMVQLSHLYLTTGKTIALTIWAFVSKVLLYLLSNYLMIICWRNL